jgi:catechol 2,3-dioxygenase-like lactoylglutathione lyase family enzyme
MKLTHTRIVARDIESLTRFYETITGVESWTGSPDYREIRTSGGVLALTTERLINGHSAGGARAADNHSAILDFLVDDVDRERSRLDGIVESWVLEPTDQPWGNRSVLFRDPEGNLINFYAPMRRSPAASLP